MSRRGPLVGVGGVVVEEGRVLLVRRGKPPLFGRWTIPGGRVELGETLAQALVREMQEETGLEVAPRRLLTVAERIEREGAGVSHHFVIVDYLCTLVSGEVRAGSDALEVAWVGPEELSGYGLTEAACDVVRDAFRLTSSTASRKPPLRRARQRARAGR